MMLTRVVEEARVKAAVKKAHMATLKSKLQPKKKARVRYSKNLLSGARLRTRARAAAMSVVNWVVVLYLAATV